MGRGIERRAIVRDERDRPMGDVAENTELCASRPETAEEAPGVDGSRLGRGQAGCHVWIAVRFPASRKIARRSRRPIKT